MGWARKNSGKNSFRERFFTKKGFGASLLSAMFVLALVVPIVLFSVHVPKSLGIPGNYDDVKFLKSENGQPLAVPAEVVSPPLGVGT